MKKIYIRDLLVGTEITDFFIVKEVGIKTGSNGKAYLDIKLGDKTGEASGKKWNVMSSEIDSLNKIKDGQIVKVRANIKEWNGNKQVDISKIRLRTETDEMDLSDFIKAAPLKPEDMYTQIMNEVNNFADDKLKQLCAMVLEENKEKLMYWPAAAKNHHAEYAGLLYHVYRMLKNGKAMCSVYSNMLNQDLLLTGVIMHDIEKIREIMSDENGISPGYSFEGQMLGHIIQGVKYLEEVCDRAGISEEKKIMLEHMILSHHYEPEFGSPKKPLFPEAEILHYLDIIDTRMYDMEEALINTEFNEFSEKVWTLDNRKLYKASDSKVIHGEK